MSKRDKGIIEIKPNGHLLEEEGLLEPLVPVEGRAGLFKSFFRALEKIARPWQIYAICSFATMLYGMVVGGLLMGVGVDGRKDSPLASLMIFGGPTVCSMTTSAISIVFAALVVERKATGGWPWETPEKHREWSQRTLFAIMLGSIQGVFASQGAVGMQKLYDQGYHPLAGILSTTAYMAMLGLIATLGYICISWLQTPPADQGVAEHLRALRSLAEAGSLTPEERAEMHQLLQVFNRR